MLGTHDLIVLVVIALFLFGAKMLPGLTGSISKSMKAFKNGISRDAGEVVSGKPAIPPAVTVGAPLACASCQTALQPDSSRCPRCEVAVSALARTTKDHK
jgi:TatA/E family protein of Tat protein translocase